ncbi:MAG: acetoacetyl-CoA reductase [Gammaproteobacteria bacterium]
MKNRICLVTGGIGDIGTHICRQFIDNGAIVVATYFGNSKTSVNAWKNAQSEAGYDIEIHELDVTVFDKCGELVNSLVSRLGGIDILVNAAGITNDSTLAKMTVEQWHSVLSINLDGIFNITRHVVNIMLDKQYGRIINISSVNGQRGSFGQTNYSSAKSGIYGFTKSLALEVAKKNITVNSVSPGFIDSGMVRQIPDNVLEKLIAQIPVGRLGQPEEVARVIAFLAADQSGYITGTNFAINGGIHMY